MYILSDRMIKSRRWKNIICWKILRQELERWIVRSRERAVDRGWFARDLIINFIIIWNGKIKLIILYYTLECSVFQLLHSPKKIWLVGYMGQIRQMTTVNWARDEGWESIKMKRNSFYKYASCFLQNDARMIKDSCPPVIFRLMAVFIPPI